jgi:hypothetical protein
MRGKHKTSQPVVLLSLVFVLSSFWWRIFFFSKRRQERDVGIRALRRHGFLGNAHALDTLSELVSALADFQFAGCRSRWSWEETPSRNPTCTIMRSAHAVVQVKNWAKVADSGADTGIHGGHCRWLVPPRAELATFLGPGLGRSVPISAVNIAARQGFLKLLSAFVSDVGVPEVQVFQVGQLLEVLNRDIGDLGAREV